VGIDVSIDANWTIAILTGVLVLVTALYAYYTKKILTANEKIVEATHRQATEQSRPFVNVRVAKGPVDQILKIKVENIGTTSARNLRLSLDKSFYQFGQIKPERNLADMYLFQNIIETLPPGADLYFNLGAGVHIFGPDAKEETTPKVMTIRAQYRGEKTYDETTVIDLNQYLYTTTEGAIPLQREMEKLITRVDFIGKELAANLAMLRKGADDGGSDQSEN
jgi:hypothetical protein